MSVEGQLKVNGRSDLPERGLEPYPEISVVVTARNAGRPLELLLAALEVQTLERYRYELIVVDDASQDDTLAVASRDPDAVVIHAEEHLGLPRGRNCGVRAARAELLAFTDADCLPDPEWLETGLERMRAEGADILAGGITIPVNARVPVAALVDSAVYLDQEKYTRRGFGAGANLWIRREVFERVGLFDERLPNYGGDEEEFCQRAIGVGAKLVYAPESHVQHPPRTRKRDLAKKAYRLGFARAAHRRYNSGPLGQQPRMFLEWRRYIPRRRIFGLDRVRAQTGALSRRQLVAMYVVQHACVEAPAMIGDLVGELAQGGLTLSRRFGRKAAVLQRPGQAESRLASPDETAPSRGIVARP